MDWDSSCNLFAMAQNLICIDYGNSFPRDAKMSIDSQDVASEIMLSHDDDESLILPPLPASHDAMDDEISMSLPSLICCDSIAGLWTRFRLVAAAAFGIGKTPLMPVPALLYSMYNLVCIPWNVPLTKIYITKHDVINEVHIMKWHKQRSYQWCKDLIPVWISTLYNHLRKRFALFGKQHSWSVLAFVIVRYFLFETTGTLWFCFWFISLFLFVSVVIVHVKQ